MPDNKIKIRVAELRIASRFMIGELILRAQRCLVPCSLRQWKSTGCGLRIH